TKRCLDDLGCAFPPLHQSPHTVGHPVVVKAQRLPGEVAAGGGERIRMLRDLVWFKAKTGTYRAAVHRLDPTPSQEWAAHVHARAWWWIGAAGTRKDDSGSDFYAALEAECRRAGRGTGHASSVHLLPGRQDRDRLVAELATRTVVGIRTTIGRLIAKSL